MFQHDATAEKQSHYGAQHTIYIISGWRAAYKKTPARLCFSTQSHYFCFEPINHSPDDGA